MSLPAVMPKEPTKMIYKVEKDNFKLLLISWLSFNTGGMLVYTIARIRPSLVLEAKFQMRAFFVFATLRIFNFICFSLWMCSDALAQHKDDKYKVEDKKPAQIEQMLHFVTRVFQAIVLMFCLAIILMLLIICCLACITSCQRELSRRAR